MDRSSDDVAGVVVVYFPDETVIHNIESYLGLLNLLVVVDNTPAGAGPLREKLEKDPRVRYFGNGENRGIAAALNQGATEAIRQGYHWILTMDQDSRFEPGSLETLLRFRKGRENLGIASPRYLLPWLFPDPVQGEWSEPVTAMTSGSLLNLDAFKTAGPFLEKLFIDYVDNEYCFRLARAGFTLRTVHDAKLRHALGKTKAHRWLGRTLHTFGHSPSRHYYIARNILYTMKTYPERRLWVLREWLKFLSLLMLERDRLSKLRFTARGVADFLRNRYGALPQATPGPGAPAGADRMKINFLIPFLEKSGGILVVMEYAHHLSRRGHDVIVYYPLWPYRDYWFSSESRIRKVLGPAKGFLINAWIRRRRAAQYRHPHFIKPIPWMGAATLRNADAVVATAFPTVYTAHRLDPKKGRKFYFVQGYEYTKFEDARNSALTDVRKVDGAFGLPLQIISIAPHLTQFLQEKFHRKVAAEIHNGIDLEVFHPPREKSWNSRIILMMHHIIEVKGIPHGMAALEEVHRKFPEVRIHLFGLYPPPPDLPGHFKYFRDPDIDTLVRLYQEAQIFLSPSLREGWHLPPMEAMACQCAVVATRVGCVPSLDDGTNMAVVEPSDPGALAAKMTQLLASPDQCRAMAMAGFQTVQRYTWSRAAAEMESVLGGKGVAAAA